MKKCCIILGLLTCFSVFAQDDDWGEDWEDDWQAQSEYQINHKISYAYAHLLDSDSVNLKNSVLNELRSKSQLEYQADDFRFSFEAELNADQVTNRLTAKVYQFNILIPFESGTDIKLGRQVITWGTGDLLFLNDLFAKDWKSLINGRDDSYLKPAIDALRVSHYADKLNAEIAILPNFEADNIFNGERYSFYLPGAGIAQPQPKIHYNQPDTPEVAARIFANPNGKEWAIYFYNGYFKSPSYFEPSRQLNYARMSSVGASLRMPFYGGVFNSEFSLYRSHEDSTGVNPFIQNSQFRLLLGYETELVSQVTMGVQAYLEKTLNYPLLNDDKMLEVALPAKNRTMLTLRLTHQALQQRLLNQLMIFYSPSDSDHYLRYQSQYTLADRWKLITGVNWFGGDNQETFFAQLTDNSNLFFRAQYSF